MGFDLVLPYIHILDENEEQIQFDRIQCQNLK